MGITDSTLKKMKTTLQQAQEKTAGKEQELSEVCTATEKLVANTVVQQVISEKSKSASNPLSKGMLFACKLGGMARRWNLMENLAGAIDRLLAENPAPVAEEPIEELAQEVAEEPIEEAAPEIVEDVVEEPVEEAPTEEEPAVEAFAEVAPVAAQSDEDGDDDEDDDEDALPEGIDTSDLEFIDIMEEPERYAEMLAQEARGEVRLINRYRRSFRSRLIQSQGSVQEYYSILKNALLSYKGIKDRTSQAFESFNKGRAKVAKINAKTRTLYLYLAIDPAELQDTKYFFDDVSDKKKYAEVPVLFKIKGERKLKHALELIEKLCGEQMALPAVKNFEAQDYTVPYQDTKSLVAEGLIRQYTAAIPVEVSVDQIAFF